MQQTLQDTIVPWFSYLFGSQSVAVVPGDKEQWPEGSVNYYGNYCGPGNKMEGVPIDDLDSACKEHDLSVDKWASTDEKTLEADYSFRDRMVEIYNRELDMVKRQRVDKWDLFGLRDGNAYTKKGYAAKRMIDIMNMKIGNRKRPKPPAAIFPPDGKRRRIEGKESFVNSFRYRRYAPLFSKSFKKKKTSIWKKKKFKKRSPTSKLQFRKYSKSKNRFRRKSKL